MADRRLLPLAVASLLIASPALPASGAAQGLRSVSAQMVLLDTEAWGMGGSGIPIPSQAIIDAVGSRYIMPASPIFPGQPIFPVDSIHPLFTPEGLYPVTGTKSLVLDQSLAQGVQILDATIKERLALGHDLVVVGASQSSTLAGLEMRNLLALPADQIPTSDQLSFILLVDPSNPNGGLLSRFGDPSLPLLTVPSMGVTFSGAQCGFKGNPVGNPLGHRHVQHRIRRLLGLPALPAQLLVRTQRRLGDRIRAQLHR